MGCTGGLIPGKLLILQCSEYAKYARFATPVYVELTLHYKAIPTASTTSGGAGRVQALWLAVNRGGIKRLAREPLFPGILARIMPLAFDL